MSSLLIGIGPRVQTVTTGVHTRLGTKLFCGLKEQAPLANLVYLQPAPSRTAYTHVEVFLPGVPLCTRSLAVLVMEVQTSGPPPNPS
jgi:hypothetical protein